MNALETALYSQLSGGTALVAALGGTAIYNGQIPADASLPCVTYSLASGMEENLTRTRSNRMVYLVKAIAPSLYQAGQIADLVDALLHDHELSPTGFHNFWTARETVVRYQEIDPAGHIIGHAGGEYAFRLERT
jgi:hypothetical protein